jgi:hypothetical protein
MRAVAADPCHAGGGGVRVGLVDPRQRPVGDPERPDLARAPVRVQRVDELRHRDGRVVAVQEVDVDRAAEAFHAVPQVGRDVLGRDARAVAVGMRALGHERDPLAHAGPVTQPPPEEPLGVAVLVDVRGVDRGAAGLHEGVEHRVVAVARRRREAERPQREPRQRRLHPLDAQPVHRRSPRRA